MVTSPAAVLDDVLLMDGELVDGEPDEVAAQPVTSSRLAAPAARVHRAARWVVEREFIMSSRNTQQGA
jgi:hypothetical protein